MLQGGAERAIRRKVFSLMDLQRTVSGPSTAAPSRFYALTRDDLSGFAIAQLITLTLECQATIVQLRARIAELECRNASAGSPLPDAAAQGPLPARDRRDGELASTQPVPVPTSAEWAKIKHKRRHRR